MTHDDDLSPLPPFGSYELWRALLAIYNHFQFAGQLSSYCLSDQESKALPFEVLAALRLQDCWLDIAIQEGWMEKVE